MYSDEDGGPGATFKGVGPTIALDARRTIGSGFSAVLGTRFSMLFGDTEENNSDDSNGNVGVPITEFRAGVEWVHQMQNGSELTLSAGYETQLYSSLSHNVDNDIDPEDVDVMLAGPYFGLGFGF